MKKKRFREIGRRKIGFENFSVFFVSFAFFFLGRITPTRTRHAHPRHAYP